MPTQLYNVFASRLEPAIQCAIAQGRPVPCFIQAEAWAFTGTVRPSDPSPHGFRHRRAEDATRIVGFYLYYAEPAQRH